MLADLDAAGVATLDTCGHISAAEARRLACAAHDCETPPGLCHAHHDQPWSQGGPTNITTERLLCGHHHRRIHDPNYQTTTHPNGKLTLHRRT